MGAEDGKIRLRSLMNQSSDRFWICRLKITYVVKFVKIHQKKPENTSDAECIALDGKVVAVARLLMLYKVTFNIKKELSIAQYGVQHHEGNSYVLFDRTFSNMCETIWDE